MDYSQRKVLKKVLREKDRMDLFYKCVWYDPPAVEEGEEQPDLDPEKIAEILINISGKKKIIVDNKDYDFADL